MATTLLDTPPSNGTGQTQATGVYDRLRRDLLTARLAPGRRLTARFLMDRYDTGQTPLREALNRLAAEGLVVSQDQRGFTVAPISAEELSELTETRCLLEDIALRRSMQAATPTWEEALLVLGHRLLRTKRSADPEHYAEDLDWEQAHRAFHRALLSLCGSRPLQAFCEQLADQLYRYRQLSVQKVYPSRDINAEHSEILHAVLANDADRACTALLGHYRATAEIVLADLRKAESVVSS